MKPVFRIFVSSPYDVVEERRVVDTVVSELREQYAAWIHLERVLWEKELLPANRGDFQELICPVEETHLVIAILWSRIGFPLGGNRGQTIKPPFRPPTWAARNPTGTELEIVQALQSYAESAASGATEAFPDLLIYRKTGTPPKVSLEEAEVASIQFREACTFFDWLTRDERDGSFKAAFYGFETLAEFEENIREHLAKWIEQRVGIGREQSVRQLTWPHGSPFRALEPFDVEHHPIFFGRQKETFDVLERCTDLERRQSALLMVLGMSGCGKSSLIRAGVIARLRARKDEDWRHAIMKPGIEGDPLEELLAALFSETALPGMRQSTLLREAVRQAPLVLAVMVDDFLRDNRLKVILFVDQFEELFTGNRSREERSVFAAMLLALAQCKNVWVIATMRSDYYHRLEELPELFAAVEREGIYHLQTPTLSAIGAIIRRPAIAAGLRFETDKSSQTGLDEVILEDAKGLGDCLPLVEFTLHRLYEIGHEDGVLSFNEYEAIGRIGGAVDRHAQTVVDTADKSAQEALPMLMDALLGVDAEGNPVRYYPKREKFGTDTPAARMIQRLIQERLLIAGEDAEHTPTIALPHDLLLSHWSAVRMHIAQNRQNMQQRQWLREAARQWKADGNNPSLLLNTERLIDRAEVVGLCSGEALDKVTESYIRESIRHSGRKGLTGWIALGAFNCLMCALMCSLLAGLLSPSFRKFCAEDIALTNVSLLHVYPVHALLTLLPLSYLALILTWRKLLPVSSVESAAKDLWISLFGLGVGLLPFLPHPNPGANPEKVLLYDVPVMTFWCIGVVNSLLIRKRIAQWRSSRKPIGTLNGGRVYVQPLFRHAAVCLVCIIMVQSAYNTVEVSKAQEKLEETLGGWSYDPQRVMSSVNGGANINTRNSYGLTALHLAAYYNDKKLVSELLGCGATVDVKDNFGNTPMFYALRGSVTGKDADVLQSLITAGADVRVRNVDGFTPLFMASAGENLQAVDALLVAGAETDICAPNGAFPAYMAAATGHSAILARLWHTPRRAWVEQLLSTAATDPEVMSFDRICCAAAWHRWRGDMEKSLSLYGRALAMDGVVGSPKETFILAEEAQTYFSTEPAHAEGMRLLEMAISTAQDEQMRNDLQGLLIWIYVQTGRFQQANEVASNLMPKLDISVGSPLWMNCAHALLYSGHFEEACKVYSRYVRDAFSSGQTWLGELGSDWRQLAWLGLDQEPIEKAKATIQESVDQESREYVQYFYEHGMPDMSFLRSPERSDMEDPDHASLCEWVTGKWRSDQLFGDRVLVTEWTIQPDGKCVTKFFHATGELYRVVYGAWKIGINHQQFGDSTFSREILWAERKCDSGAISLDSVNFPNDDHDMFLLTSKEDPAQMTAQAQRLYRRVR